MKKCLLLAYFCLMLCNSLMAGDEITGFWKSIDDDTKKPQSVVAIYQYNGKYYGRLILTYDKNGHIKDTIYQPSERAPGVSGDPYYVGLDFLWDLTKDGHKYTDGQIMDPEKGRIYGAEAWRDGNNLIVRGEFLFIGRNQKWPPAGDGDFPPNFQKPDLATLIPKIPQVK